MGKNTDMKNILRNPKVVLNLVVKSGCTLSRNKERGKPGQITKASTSHPPFLCFIVFCT